MNAAVPLEQVVVLRRYPRIDPEAVRAALGPWDLPPPPFGTHLPGGGCELAIAPAIRWPIAHRNVRGLHGLLTALVNERHDERVPAWTLFPWRTAPARWAVYFRRDELAAYFAGRTFPGRFYAQEIQLTFSPLRRLRAPQVPIGRVRLLLETETPVCIRVNRGPNARTHLAPTADHLRAALTGDFPVRLGLPPIDPATVAIDLLHHATAPVELPIGGRFGRVQGWTGRCVIEVNAVAHALLRAAALVGLGGRTAVGLGRIRVTPHP